MLLVTTVNAICAGQRFFFFFFFRVFLADQFTAEVDCGKRRRVGLFFVSIASSASSVS